MLDTGNFAAPHMFGYPYFEKPAPGHWLTALNLYLFGRNAFAIRLASAAMTGLSALFVALTILAATGRDRRMAALGSMMYLFCGMVFGLGVFCVLDAPMTAFSTGAMFCIFAALQKERPRLSRFLLLALCGVCCGAGFMVKGFPALVVPALGAAGFLLWEKRWKELFLYPWPVLLFAVLTVLPWGIAVHKADGDFWRYFIEVEHIQRFTENTSGQHPEPWYFLLPFFFGGIFPSAFLLAAGAGGGRKVIKEMLKTPLCRFALCAAVLPLILFSCSKGKLPTYILPCFPALAILMAQFTALCLRSSEKAEKAVHILLNVLGGIFAAAGLLAVPAGYLLQFARDTGLDLDPELFERLEIFSPLVLAAGASCIAGGTLLLLTKEKIIRFRLWFFAVLLALPAMVIPFFIDPRLKADKMPADTLYKIRKEFGVSPENVQVATIPSLMHAAAWCFQTPDVISLNAIGEMEYADKRAVKEGRPRLQYSTADFIRLVQKPRRKNIVYLHWSRRDSIRVPGVRPAQQYTAGEIKAYYYPAKFPAGKGADTGK